MLQMILVTMVTLYAVWYVEKENSETTKELKDYFGLGGVPKVIIYFMALIPIAQFIVLIFYIMCILIDKGIFE